VAANQAAAPGIQTALGGRRGCSAAGFRRHALSSYGRGQTTHEGFSYYFGPRHRQVKHSAKRQPRAKPRPRRARLQGRADSSWLDGGAKIRLPLQHGAADGRAKLQKRRGFQGRNLTNVVELATLVQRSKRREKLWDSYVTHSGQFPEPMLLAGRKLGGRAHRAGGAQPAKTGRARRVQPGKAIPSSAGASLGQGAGGGRVRRRFRTSTSASSTDCPQESGAG